MSLTLCTSTLVATCLVFALATRYEFILDNDEVFDNCPDIPGNKGIHELGDISQMTFDFSDGSVKASGNITLIWEGVQPTDRIECYGEVLKHQRSSWQPTPLSASVQDFCAKQFDKLSIWYQVWTRHIPKQEQSCINNVGHSYHHQPFDADTFFDFVVNVEGRHKIVVHMFAYDEHNVQRPKSICFQIFGEFVKSK